MPGKRGKSSGEQEQPPWLISPSPDGDKPTMRTPGSGSRRKPPKNKGTDKDKDESS